MNRRVSGPRLQPIGPAATVARGAVAAVVGAAMITGAYPLIPALLQARARRQSMLRRLGSLDLVWEWGRASVAAAVRPLSFVGLPGNRRRGRRPVILIHGYVMGRSSFLLLAQRLARAGLGPIVGYEYWTLGSIAAAARGLGRLVDRVLELSGADRVDLIGHSMGGLVGRYYVALGGGGDTVARLITLGTPHAGADGSFIGPGRARIELRRGSATLERMAVAKLPPDTAVTVIHSRADVLVGGRRHMQVPGAEILELDGVNHIEMITSRRVADAILARLY